MSGALIPEAPVLMVVAIILLSGVAWGGLARRLHLPGITGQIVGGVVLGQAGLSVFSDGAIHSLQGLTDFALGLMAVTVGAHLNVRRLRNAGTRLLMVLVAETILIPLFVFVGMSGFGLPWSVSLLFGAIAVSTAPATVVAIVKETRSKGVFVKTLVAAVALNNIACIVVFELARVAAHIDLGSAEPTALEVIGAPLLQLGEAALVGCSVAVGMQLLTRVVTRPEIVATGGFIAILLTSGLASFLGVSPLLACLFIGLTQTNLTGERDRVVDKVFSNFEPAILSVFFTLAGMELSFEHASHVGALALAFFFLRLLGKLVAGFVSMRLAGATEKVRANLGLALIPQAGVAVGLVVLLEEDEILQRHAGEIIPDFMAAVLTAVVINEVVGPIFTRLALSRSGEEGRDRTRLIDFIHEENIVTDFEADNKEQALERLVDLLITSHHLEPSLRPSLLQSVLEREKEFSTCLGSGLAIPHGILPTGHGMLGVMGISRRGLDFDTPDTQPIHYIILIMTPDTERDRHLQVLAAIAHTIGHDVGVQAALCGAKTAAHAYEILHNEESEGFNYFMDESIASSRP